MNFFAGAGLITLMVLGGCGSSGGSQNGDDCRLLAAMIGLGAMVSSPSQYAGSAVMEGVGAGAESYGGCQ